MIRHDRSLRTAGWLATVGMAAVALFAPATVSAWVHPTITPLCAPDANHYEFTVTLAHESNYKFDWSFGNSGPWTTVVGQQGANDLVVARGQGNLYVRWTSDHGSFSSATPDGVLCVLPTPSPSNPVESETLPPVTDPPTDSPTPSITDSPTPSITDSPTPSITDSPTPSITDSPTPSITDSPTPSITDSPTPSISNPIQSETVPPTATLIPPVTASPSGSVLGETGTPQITPPPTDGLSSTGTTPGDGWRLLLLVGATLTGSLLVVTPARRRTRR